LDRHNGANTDITYNDDVTFNGKRKMYLTAAERLEKLRSIIHHYTLGANENENENK
jgi:hypothetical protein